MVNPLTGQANFSENVMRSGFSSFDAISNIVIPSAKSSDVLKLSASLCSIPSFMTILSITTSMLCLNFLSNSGTSSKS